MEALTRLVSESLARHGFDRPVDYRRLRWSRWFRCESHHSLLVVPSKPGVFAIAEEVMDLGTNHADTDPSVHSTREAGQPAIATRRMLAVTQFFEDDDMAFVLDRMLSQTNPMRARLLSGQYFIRFVVIEDQSQRRSICTALNQWMGSAAEKATGIGSHFATSLELTPEPAGIGMLHVSPVSRDMGIADESGSSSTTASTESSAASPHLSVGAAPNINCPPKFRSDF